MAESTRKQQVQQGNVTRAQAAKIAHQKANEQRAQTENELRISYKKIKDEPAFQDILTKAKQFAGYHLKMAKDGVGFRETGQRDDSGNPVQETVFFDQHKRVTELDKAAGIDEIVGYIEGRVTEERLQPLKAKKIVTEEREEEA